MNQREAKRRGRERGECVATWVDIPETGTKVSPCIDYVGIGKTVTQDNRLEYMEMEASESESNDRQFSPFEFTASEINGSRNSDECWEQFDEGIALGIHDELRKRLRALGYLN